MVSKMATKQELIVVEKIAPIAQRSLVVKMGYRMAMKPVWIVAVKTVLIAQQNVLLP